MCRAVFYQSTLKLWCLTSILTLKSVASSFHFVGTLSKTPAPVGADRRTESFGAFPTARRPTPHPVLQPKASRGRATHCREGDEAQRGSLRERCGVPPPCRVQLPANFSSSWRPGPFGPPQVTGKAKRIYNMYMHGGSQRHFSLVKVLLFPQSHPRQGCHLANFV